MLVHKREEVNDATVDFVIDVIGKRFRSSAGKSVRSNVVASATSDHFANLADDAFA